MPRNSPIALGRRRPSGVRSYRSGLRVCGVVLAELAGDDHPAGDRHAAGVGLGTCRCHRIRPVPPAGPSACRPYRRRVICGRCGRAVGESVVPAVGPPSCAPGSTCLLQQRLPDLHSDWTWEKFTFFSKVDVRCESHVMLARQPVFARGLTPPFFRDRISPNEC